MAYKYGDKLEEHIAPCGCVVIIHIEEWSACVGDVVDSVEIKHHCKVHNQTFKSEEPVMSDKERLTLPDNTVPGYVPSPGRVICDELKARGWSQRDLADKMVRPPQVVNDIINAKTEITTETAIELGAAFGTSADFWLNLEKDYRLWLEGQESEEWCLLPSQLKKPQGYMKYKLKEGCYDEHGGSLPSAESEE